MKDRLGHGSNPRGARQELTALRQAADKRYAKRMEPPGTTPAQRALIASLGRPQNEPNVPLGLAVASAKGALLMARLNAGDIPAAHIGVHIATYRKNLNSRGNGHDKHRT